MTAADRRCEAEVRLRRAKFKRQILEERDLRDDFRDAFLEIAPGLALPMASPRLPAGLSVMLWRFTNEVNNQAAKFPSIHKDDLQLIEAQ